MIKECPIIKKNEFVTVVRFNNTDIQFPAIYSNQKMVLVSYDGGKYSIVEKPKENDIKPARTTDKKVDKSTKKENNHNPRHK